MKTTVEIADVVFHEARRVAAARSVTMRQIIENGLRKVIAEASAPFPFRLQDGSFGGEGLVQPMTWDEIRDEIYEGRGA